MRRKHARKERVPLSGLYQRNASRPVANATALPRVEAAVMETALKAFALDRRRRFGC
jgi:hypothetical protein